MDRTCARSRLNLTPRLAIPAATPAVKGGRRARPAATPVLKEVPIRDAIMRRRLSITWRGQGYLSPAVQRVIDLFAAESKLSYPDAR